MTEEIKKYIETASYGDLVKCLLLIHEKLKSIDASMGSSSKDIAKYNNPIKFEDGSL